MLQTQLSVFGYQKKIAEIGKTINQRNTIHRKAKGRDDKRKKGSGGLWGTQQNSLGGAVTKKDELG